MHRQQRCRLAAVLLLLLLAMLLCCLTLLPGRSCIV
jgi:hypothetical protein